jgi:hypothetical protein
MSGGAGERPGDAQVDAVRGGVDRATRGHRVLPRDAVEDLLRRDAERRELGVVELDEDLLRLLADDVDLVDVGHAQQLLADVLGAGLEIGEAHAFRGQHVERGIDVAVLVVEARPDHTGRQIAPDVADLLAHLVPQLLHLGRRRAVEEEDLDERHPRLRVALDAVEIGKLLELLLDPVGDLGLHFARGGAGPGRSDDHCLDGEGRVLGAPKVEIRIDPCPAEHDDHEQDERAVVDRPFRKIETHVRGSPVSIVQWASTTRTFSPAPSFWTPSVTTRSPACTPAVSGAASPVNEATSTRRSSSIPALSTT